MYKNPKLYLVLDDGHSMTFPNDEFVELSQPETVTAAEHRVEDEEIETDADVRQWRK